MSAEEEGREPFDLTAAPLVPWTREDLDALAALRAVASPEEVAVLAAHLAADPEVRALARVGTLLLREHDPPPDLGPYYGPA